MKEQVPSCNLLRIHIIDR